MSFWDYDAERHLRIEKEDSYAEGFQKGTENGFQKGFQKGAESERERADAAEQELLRLREEIRKLKEDRGEQ